MISNVTIRFFDLLGGFLTKIITSFLSFIPAGPSLPADVLLIWSDMLIALRRLDWLLPIDALLQSIMIYFLVIIAVITIKLIIFAYNKSLQLAQLLPFN